MGQCLTGQDTRPSGVGNPCSRIRGQYDDGIKFHTHTHTRKNHMGEIIGISVAVALPLSDCNHRPNEGVRPIRRLDPSPVPLSRASRLFVGDWSPWLVGWDDSLR